VKRANTLGKRDWRQVNQRFPKETPVICREVDWMRTGVKERFLSLRGEK
jgi:hypothetical protein